MLRSGSCLVSFLCCNLFISDTDQGRGGGVLLVLVMVMGWFLWFVLIYISQALLISHIMRFLDCSQFVLYSFIVLWDIAHAVYFQHLACMEPLRAGVEAQ
jgi:hypothetical protein